MAGYLALLWHQHQPLYRPVGSPQEGGYRQPWVRLHAIRDYYPMAALVAQHPHVHLTINLTPVLLWQIDDYLEGASDRSLQLTLTPAERLTPDERDEILSSFFDAHWHNQIYPHPRYHQLFTKRAEGGDFSDQDIRDLQMWFNLSWFAPEFRQGEVTLPSGDSVSVRRFVAQEAGFTPSDLEAMVECQLRIMEAVAPMHRLLQDQGQIEVSTTPFAHPILPLLLDTDRARIDRPGASHPVRFAHPEDAEGQVEWALEVYRSHFGRPPLGVWPAEGAVSAEILPLLGEHGLAWAASDEGVLASSGRWGYEVHRPEVLSRPYRPEDEGVAFSLFFRDRSLSDAIGFRYHGYPDQEAAAAEFVEEVGRRLEGSGGEGVVTVVLDGENAWGDYREDARPFLHALYRRLGESTDLRSVTFTEYLTGNAERGVEPHPVDEQHLVYQLATGSWIDEWGSEPGVDLGTWVGEPEENRAWELLGAAREAVADHGAGLSPGSALYTALYAAEGSDWFWWYGEDQSSGRDGEFDDLFRAHLTNVYLLLSLPPPPELGRRIVPDSVVWTFAGPVARIQPGDRLVVRTNCPGTLRWRVDDGPETDTAPEPVGGVLAGLRRYEVTLGPLPPGTISFAFRCGHPDCDHTDPACRGEPQAVTVG